MANETVGRIGFFVIFGFNIKRGYKPYSLRDNMKRLFLIILSLVWGLVLFPGAVWGDISEDRFTEASVETSLSDVANVIVLVILGLVLLGFVLPIVEYFRFARRRAIYRIVLLRHGESVWNKENRFTGWTDVGLSDLGAQEAKEAGQILKEEGYLFDLVFTSVLARAIETTSIALREMGLAGVDTKYSWQLNERHYGGLQGMNKAEMVQKYGEKQVHIWRRSYDVRPPEMTADEFLKQNSQEIFKNIKPENLPTAESLKDTYIRAVGYWQEEIMPQIKLGRKILVSAHGNSLRAIVKYLDNIGDDKISDLNIPTGVPLVYELDGDLRVVRHYYLGDVRAVEAKIDKVKNQSKVK